LNGVCRSTWKPSVKVSLPTSVGDWMVTSALIVKAEDFKDRQSAPRIKKRLICWFVELAPEVKDLVNAQSSALRGG
jgi:hypothetical protein